MNAIAPAPARRRASFGLLAAAATAVVASGCGGAGGADADPAKVAPQGSVVYVVGTLRPSGGQKEAVDSLASKVFKTPNPGQRIQSLLDKEFKEDPASADVTYKKDIDPWLGNRAALAVTGLSGDGQFAVIAATKDAAKFKELLEREAKTSSPRWAKRSYKGTSYWFDSGDSTAFGAVGDYAVVGMEPSFKAVVDASEGKGLDQKAGYKEVASGATDKFGFGYIDTRALLAAANASGQLPPGVGQAVQSQLGSGTKPVTMSLDPATDKLTLEVVARGVPARPGGDRPPQLVGALPGDSWLAIGAPAVGASLKKTITQLSASLGQGAADTVRQQIQSQTGLDLDRDVLAAIGDLAVFARGTSLLSIGGGIVIQSPDPAAAKRLVDKLQPFIARQGGSGLRVAAANVAGAEGFSVRSDQVPAPINVLVKGDRLVIAFTDSATQAALSSTQQLAIAPDYKAAEQSLGAPPSVFVSFAPIAQLVGTQSATEAKQVQSYLTGLRTLAVGTKTDGDTQTSRFVLSVK